ncbi:hypothetical protein WDV85_16750 [Pseudokineococcus sp. 5B2Z-1]|uniref:hypothetical protein n=1 Tax=Pseudokineococcus sp. 5B2Z-1 TaxID=3132744 RepID=UPI0030A26D26
MSTQQTTPPPTSALGLARTLTDLLSPGNLLVAVQLLVGAVSGNTLIEGFAWGALAALFTAGLPYAFVLRGVRKGRYGDHHIGERRQRTKPFLFAAASVLAGLVLLTVLGAPTELLALTLAALVGLLLILVTTLVWKISVHTGVAAGVVSVASMTFSPFVVVAPLVVLAVGWSRVALRDHTVAQVVGGAVLGAIVAATLFSTLR